MAFSSVRDRLKDVPTPLISEADPDFAQKANLKVRETVAIAEKQAGVSARDPEWERTATPEQRRLRQQETLSAEKKLSADEIAEYDKTGKLVAKYKLEVTFGNGRKSTGDNICLIQAWESGSKLHGGGDQLMFVCTDTAQPDPRKRAGCNGFISGDDIISPPSLDDAGNAVGGVAFCRGCGKQVVASRLGVALPVQGDYQKIAAKLVDLFRRLKSNADIYIKYHKTDPRYLAMVRREGTKRAHELKGMHIYPLDRIVKDTSAGADIGLRFKAFLTS